MIKDLLENYQGIAAFLKFSLLTIVSLFPIVDPLAIIPIFNSTTSHLPTAVVHRVAVRACLFALGLALGFGFLGEYIFEIFHITIHGLKVVGGVIFFIMGYDMLGAKVTRTKVSQPHSPVELEAINDFAITPLAIPFLCGPGAITKCIILMNDTADSLSLKAAFCLGTCVTFFFTFLCLIGARQIASILGDTGNRVILRLMGLIIMIIAVESFFSGLTPIIREILRIPA